MIILLSLFYVYYYSFTIYYCFSILVRHRIANVMLLRLSIPPLFFKKLYKSDSKKKIYVNENKLPKSAGPHLLRNVLTWAVKQRNHRMILNHFNFIVLFYLFIKKLQVTLVLNFFSSWPKIAIVDVCNTCSGYTESYSMRECHNIKTYKKTWNESWQHFRFPRQTPALKALIYQFINKFINLSPA